MSRTTIYDGKILEVYGEGEWAVENAIRDYERRKKKEEEELQARLLARMKEEAMWDRLKYKWINEQ